MKVPVCVLFRYMGALGRLRETTLQKGENASAIILGTVEATWHDNTQMLTIIVDRLLTYRLVDGKGVIAWVFSAPMLPHLTRSVLVQRSCPRSSWFYQVLRMGHCALGSLEGPHKGSGTNSRRTKSRGEGT